MVNGGARLIRVRIATSIRAWIWTEGAVNNEQNIIKKEERTKKKANP
jgi:hypothetical protein